MANIAAGDVTYTVTKQSLLEDGRRMNVVTLAFGDGVLTYPAGGIPITIGKLGCPTAVDSLSVIDRSTSGYTFTYDLTNSKLLVFQSAGSAHTHDLLLKGGQAAAGTAAAAWYATDILGKEAATDKTILGADSATKGGVLASTPASGAEAQASTVAIAAQTIIVQVIGW